MYKYIYIYIYLYVYIKDQIYDNGCGDEYLLEKLNYLNKISFKRIYILSG